MKQKLWVIKPRHRPRIEFFSRGQESCRLSWFRNNFHLFSSSGRFLIGLFGFLVLSCLDICPQETLTEKNTSAPMIIAALIYNCKDMEATYMSIKRWMDKEIVVKEETGRTGSILKVSLHLGLDCGLWAICPVSIEMTYQLENQAPRMEEPQGSYLDTLLPRRIP